MCLLGIRQNKREPNRSKTKNKKDVFHAHEQVFHSVESVVFCLGWVSEEMRSFILQFGE